MPLFDQCQKCRKKYLGVKDYPGLCGKCSAEWAEQKDRTISFIDELSESIGEALGDTIIISAFGLKRINTIKAACDRVEELVDKLDEYPMLWYGMQQTAVKENSFTYHPITRNYRIDDFQTLDLEPQIRKLKSDLISRKADCYVASLSAYDYSDLFHIVGVTFENDDGKRRQDVLQRMALGYHENDSRKMRLEKTKYKDEDAVGVFFGKNQIGNISRTDLPYMLRNWENYYCVDGYEIIGGDIRGVIARVCFRGEKIGSRY